MLPLQRMVFVIVCVTVLSLETNALRKNINPKERRCRRLARTLNTQDPNKKDAQFFKQCVLDYFGFRSNGKLVYVPAISSKNFIQSNKRNYMTLIAKRVERFFIRNGNWHNILKQNDLFNFRWKRCDKLLYIVAAKYVYALYILNTLRNQLLCVECTKKRPGYALQNRGSVCYIKPRFLSCTQEIDISLLGHKSGSLTALFNQFFKEPTGETRKVPGFKEDSDILMGVRISAFSLEKALPTVFMGVDVFHTFKLQMIVAHMKQSNNMKLLSLAVAIFRMKGYSKKFFNELLSDQSPLRAKINLARAFQLWSVELTSFESKIKSFMASPHYNYELNYYRRHNIAFELVTGRLEASDIPSSWVSSLAEHAMCLINNVPVYLTPGAVRHSVIQQKYISRINKRFLNLQLEDYWQAMLENWANAVRTYKKECSRINYKIGPCLLRMSKSLYLMFDAMVKMKPLLEKIDLGKAKENLKELADILAITKTWVVKYRNTGHTTLPIQTPFRSYHHKRPPRVAFSDRKRPSGMMSQRPSDIQPSEDDDISWNEEDDFPERIEPELTTENENKGAMTDLSATDDKSSTGTHGAEHLDADTKDEHQMEPQTNRIEGSHNDVKTSNDTKSRSKHNEVHETEPLTKYSDGLKDEKILENENDDAENIINNKPPSEHAGEPVESHVESRDEENDEISSEIYHTTPFTPEFIDMAEPAELNNYKKFETSQEMKPLQIDVDAPADAFVKRTLPKNDMEKQLDDEEGTADSSMSEPENKENMKDGEIFMVEPLNKNGKENAASSMTNPMDVNDVPKIPSMDEDKDRDSKMKENMDKSVDASMTKLEKQDIEESTKTADSEKPLNKDSKESVGSLMEGMLNKDSKKSVGSPVEKPQNKDSEEHVGSPVEKPQNKDFEKHVGSPVEKPQNKDSEESVGSPVEKPQNKDLEKLVGSPVEKTQNKDFEKSASSPIRIPEESVGSQIGNKTKDHPQSVSQFLRFSRRRRYRSVYRRRRYRSVYRRRRYHSVYRRRRFSPLARRRRSARYGRRRRTQYSRRRRTSPPVPKINPRLSDETQNIKKFLSKFYCSFRPRIYNMMLRDACMGKIQKRIRKYNRVAFAYFAKKHGHARSFGWRELMRKIPNDEDVLVKTEL